jgi:DNA-binding NtrC family response regulator
MNTKPQILVVDDDAVVGKSFDRVLSKKGYEVSTAMTGEDALNNYDVEDFDLVFTDIKMPGMDGLEVTERIKARCPWTPVVVVTGYGTKENEARASVLGASGFVNKPLTPEIIESVTLKALQEKAPVAKPRVKAAAPQTQAEPQINEANAMGTVAKNIGLFLAAPFIALGYVIALPFVGMGALAIMSYRAYKERRSL